MQGSASAEVAECCWELEEVCDEIIDLIRRKYDEEKEVVCYKTPKLPALNVTNVFFGLPTLIRSLTGIAVVGLGQVPIRDGSPSTCPYDIINRVGIHWWYYDRDFETAHRNTMRMGEVIKRILIRNPRIVAFGKPHTEPIEFDEIVLGEDVHEAFEGVRQAYASGRMQIRFRRVFQLALDEK